MLSSMHYNLNRLNLFQPRERIFAAVAFLLGAVLPISTSLVNWVVAVMILCLFFQGRRIKFAEILFHPLVLLPIIIFSLLAFSLFYRYSPEGVKILLKYKKLLFIPLFILFFSYQTGLIKLFVRGFLLANGLILLISLLMSMFNLPVGNAGLTNVVVFKSHITQNFFMALAVVMWIALAYQHKGRERLLYMGLSLVASYHILFMVQGRIGYLALGVVLIVWIWFTFNRWKKGLFLLAMMLATLGLLTVPNQAVKRIKQGLNEMEACVAFHAGHSDQTCDTSMGLRVDFILTSLSLVKAHPIIGYGVGGFVYQHLDSGEKGFNPHNQYLLELVQSGLVGFTLFLAWIFFCYRAAWHQEVALRNVLLALLSAYMAGNLFNSFLLDFAESYLFVIVTAVLAMPKTHLVGLFPKRD